MHYAVWQQHTEAVRLLLVRGADINAIDDCGYSALHLAAEHGYYDLTLMLLEMGAKVDYRQPTDESFPRTTLSDEPLRLALKNKHYVSICLLYFDLLKHQMQCLKMLGKCRVKKVLKKFEFLKG